MERTRESIMSEKEFADHIANSLNLKTFECVRKFKSVLRAFRRGNITSYGEVIPKRPFHNRKNTCKRAGHHSRSYNEFKKRLYGEYKFREAYHKGRV